MRKLETGDVFALCRCLKKLGVKEKFQAIAKDANTVEDIWDRGFDLVWDLFDVATETNGESELCTFLANPFEMTPEEVTHLPIDELFDKLKQLAAENNLLTFFKYAARLMK